MLDTFEFPWILHAVVPLVRVDFALVNKHVVLTLGHAVRAHQLFGLGPGRVPGFAAVIRALDDLAEPAARLRRVNPVWINRRTFEVIHLPTREVRPADFPILALAVGGQNKRAL